MTKSISSAAASLLLKALEALGVRPVRSGSVTLHWDKTGSLAGWEERRHVSVTTESVEKNPYRVHTESP